MITTHVLDTALGRPAQGVAIELERLDSTWHLVGAGITDADGRLKTLTPAGPVTPATYRIRFQTGQYFESTGGKGFFPLVEIVFSIEDGAAHYHVPLLLSPYGYSTYRGS
jgi:5-hydroxyisourate hydrolase